MENLEIVPAILPTSFGDLESHLERIKGLSGFVQIDVLDGQFGGDPSWPFEGDHGEFKALRREELGLPHWEDFDFEIDIMTDDPLADARDWLSAGASRLVLHVERININRDRLELEQLRSEGLTDISLAINLSTENERLEEILSFADAIQIMGIEPIGKQGQPFDNRTLEKIQYFRDKYPDVSISVDGGMNPETARLCVEHGANKIIAGSYIFESMNPGEAIRNLQEIV